MNFRFFNLCKVFIDVIRVKKGGFGFKVVKLAKKFKIVHICLHKVHISITIDYK